MKQRSTKRAARRLPEVLSEEELLTIVKQASLRAPTGIRNRALLLVMGRCGLRVSEAAGLQSKDVDNASIHVWRGKGAKDRTVPLDGDTAAAIEAWRAVRKKLGIRSASLFCTITRRADGSDFETSPGRSLSPAYIWQMVSRYARRAGLEKQVHPHTLRHTAATFWLRLGFNLREIQVLLGHADVTTTQIYTHVDETEIAAKIAKVPALGI